MLMMPRCYDTTAIDAALPRRGAVGRCVAALRRYAPFVAAVATRAAAPYAVLCHARALFITLR